MWQDSTNEDVPAGAANGSARGASRRKRTSFSKEHVELLRTTFRTDPYPGISVREQLSMQTGIPESRIQVWFQNRRARTLKGAGSKKTAWKTSSPVHDVFAPPPPSEALQRPHPSAYQVQVMQEMDNNFYYGQSSPPVCQNGQNHMQYGDMFAPQGGAPLGSCWVQQGCSQAPSATPIWCQPPLDVMSGGPMASQAAFNFQGPADHQDYVAPSPSPPFGMRTLNLGLGDNILEDSPTKDSLNTTLDDLLSMMAQKDSSGERGAPAADAPEQREPLSQLSLGDVLEVLHEDWLEGQLKKAGSSGTC